MSAVLAVLLLCILGVPQGSQGQTILNSIKPTIGSLAGGTRISIYGTGFGDMYTSSRVVFIGPYPCSIISHLSSSSVLTCETAPGLAGTYFLTISVDGADPTSYWGYTYYNDITPTFKAVTPHAGPPGTLAYLYGDTTWYLRYRDCVESTWGDIDCVGSILFGDYLCRQDPTDADTAITFNGADSQRYGYSVYRIGCTLPTPDASNSQPAIGTAGNFNATVHFEASMFGGMPLTLLSSYMYDTKGQPYHFQLYPEVSSISPAIGSIAGGTLVQITGRGFPTSALGLSDAVNVSIAGVPCIIVNSTYDTVFCVTGPKAAAASSSATPIGGLYTAMRGLEYEFYNISSTLYFSQLWRLNKTIFLNNTAGTGSYKTVLTSVAEGPDYTKSYYCSRMKAFFTAPHTGNYRFYMQADDYGQLNGTWRQSNGIEVTQMLINLTTWTPVDTWFMRSIQVSPPVNLAANQRILLESSHCNGPSVGNQQIGVQMPVPQPQANSMAEIQKVTVTSSFAPHQLYIKYMYGAGDNTTAYTVTVAVDDDSKLNNSAL
ncbi:hypothetical protein Agub_g1046, partial [Astrephomene gubernaculifera]